MDVEQESQPIDRDGKSPGKDDDGEPLPDPDKARDPSKKPVFSISKKMRREEAEAMDAETQRLLRESKKVAFPEGQLQQKPISSVLEKMRQRKLERAQRSAQQGTSSLGRRPTLDMKKAVTDEDTVNVNMDDDLEVVMIKPPMQQAAAIKQEPVESNGISKSEIHILSKSEELPRPALINSQDLYSDSQLSPSRDEGADPSGLHGAPVPQLDSETQTDYSSSPADDEEKEIKPPTRGMASFVGVLIDDEAEDEDEDLLADEEDEADAENAAEELQDMLTQDVVERKADRKRRDNLHRKWLEEQDSSLTDSIINRLENGWKSRAKKQRLPGILDEAENNDTRGSYSQATEEAEDEPASTPSGASPPTLFEETLCMPKNQGLKQEKSPEPGGLPEDGDAVIHESEDEEEDERLRRQRLLNESDEQSDLPSVHDDESSRQIFSLISKVNVATTRTTKVTLGLSDSRPLSLGHPHALSNVQCSFARRTVTSSVHATTRQGSGNSRSYVFGRDDSSSNHASRLQENEPKSGEDSAAANVAGEIQKTSSRSNSSLTGVSSDLKDKGKTPESTGPSLIQILKQQAADLERSILTRDTSSWNVNRSSSGDLSIFSVMRPSKPCRKSKA
ncbi:hypothetical protein R1flu_007024 [Riccia fluitans]|uniref:Uncharacterized protein n=1 Tax=Riccia fluitans TaxID=41844 RepID=A0ABD1YYI6_9MARC